MKKQIIYSNYTEHYTDEAYEEWLSENDLTEDECSWVDYYNEVSNIYYEDEVLNLDRQLDEDIIIIADLGLWNGKRQGYRREKNNLSNVLNTSWVGDYIEVYYDGYNIKAIDCHHDGCNRYLFRKWKTGLSERQKEDFLNKIYEGEKITGSTLNHYTTSLINDLKACYYGEPNAVTIDDLDFYATVGDPYNYEEEKGEKEHEKTNTTAANN